METLICKGCMQILIVFLLQNLNLAKQATAQKDWLLWNLQCQQRFAVKFMASLQFWFLGFLILSSSQLC